MPNLRRDSEYFASTTRGHIYERHLSPDRGDDTFTRHNYDPQTNRIRQVTEATKGLLVFVSDETAERVSRIHKTLPKARILLRRIPAYGKPETLKTYAQVTNGDELVVVMTYEDDAAVVQWLGKANVVCTEGQRGLAVGEHTGDKQALLLTQPLMQIQGDMLNRLFRAKVK